MGGEVEVRLRKDAGKLLGVLVESGSGSLKDFGEGYLVVG